MTHEKIESGIKGLKLNEKIVYNKENSGLTKLFFEKPSEIVYGSWIEKLSNVNIVEDTYKLNFQDSEETYSSLECPVYILTANIGERAVSGFLRGVIRPPIEEDIGDIVDGLAPEFHFFIEDFDGAEYGRSISYEEASKKLVVGLSEWKINDYEKFTKAFMKDKPDRLPAWFKVKLPPENRRTAYFRQL
jgi:hypothetical protein